MDILMSIRPEWCELIASGKKAIEIRKSKPKLEEPFDVYIYCTDSTKEIFYRRSDYLYDNFLYTPKHKEIEKKKLVENGYTVYNGKIIGKFLCCLVKKYDAIPGHARASYFLTDKEFAATGFDYLEDLFEYGNDKPLYGWHISDLEIYDKPLDLSEFGKCGYDSFVPWKRPPQSWGYCERSKR